MTSLILALLLTAEPDALVPPPPAPEPVMVTVQSLLSERARLLEERPSLAPGISKLITSGLLLSVGLTALTFGGLYWPRPTPGSFESNPSLSILLFTVGGSITLAGILALSHGLHQFFRTLPARISNTQQIDEVNARLTTLGALPAP